MLGMLIAPMFHSSVNRGDEKFNTIQIYYYK